MNLLFCTTFWENDPVLAEAKKPELLAWRNRVEDRFLRPEVFLATGCQDNPRLNPIRLWLGNDTVCVNSGEPKTKVYDVMRWSYFLCAFEAALWHAKERLPSWELLVELESDCWINPSVNVPELFDQFLSRDELILSPPWHGRPDFNFLVMKPAALPAFLHHRLRGNLVDGDKPCSLLAEDELAEIFKGRWWNPWPELQLIRQHHGIAEHRPHWRIIPDDEAKRWPVVALPSPEIKKLFSLSYEHKTA